MAWTPPGNRSNQHIQRHRFQLYVMPKSDKTGILSRVTQSANEVLANITYKYAVGLRVRAIDRINAEHITGNIIAVHNNIGLNEYVIRDDNGKRYYIAERDIRMVLSIMVAPTTQRTQTLDNVA